MMRHLILIPLLLALGACAGVVDSLSGRTSAGAGLASSTHVTTDRSKSGCPDFTAQGALQVTGMTASCSDSPTMGHNESFNVQSADPNQALATAFNAQVMQTNKILDALGPLLGQLLPLLAASQGIPVKPPVVCPPGQTTVVTSAGTACQ